jgi:hypothetical protein
VSIREGKIGDVYSRVVQRFGDVKRPIGQTLDPIISAHFRDVAQTTQMLDLLTHVDISIAANRGEAQLAEATRLAERDVARADGEASRVAQTGAAEAGDLDRIVDTLTRGGEAADPFDRVTGK